MNAIFLSIAVLLVAAFIFVYYRTQQAQKENPPLGEFMDIGGVRLHYIDRGEGPPVVLLHGNGSMIQDFDSSGLIQLQASHHRVIVFDRPGYGYSSRPLGRSWNHRQQAELFSLALQRLGVERPIVVGHSWGTLVAISLGLQYPSYVKSLVLLSGYYFPTFRLDVPLMSVPAIPLLGDIMRYTVSPLISRIMWPLILRVIFGPSPVPLRFKSEFPVWMALRPSQLRAAAVESALIIPAAFDLRRHYQELKMPISIMAGANDRVVNPQRHSITLSSELPHSNVQIMPNVGHMIHHITPTQVSQAIDTAMGKSM